MTNTIWASQQVAARPWGRSVAEGRLETSLYSQPTRGRLLEGTEWEPDG